MAQQILLACDKLLLSTVQFKIVIHIIYPFVSEL